MGYTETYTYDNNGNVASMTDKNGTVTTNTYNAVNSLLTSVAGNETISYTVGNKRLIYTGLRVWEACAPQWKHVDFNNALLHIRQTSVVYIFD